MPRFRTVLAMAGYCVVLLLAFDFIYSNFIHAPERMFRIADARFNHGFTANFDGYDRLRDYYRVFTNDLSFKDASVRDVPMKADRHRILLVGDSFTEGMGLPFEETFAGLLFRAGNDWPEKTEFLNAGVAGYSPVIYYQRTKFLIESGLQFDEVIVFADVSDVSDEATAFFCIDDNPEYKKFCGTVPPRRFSAKPRSLLQRNFWVIDSLQRLVKTKISAWRQVVRQEHVLGWLQASPLAAWTVPNDFGKRLDPLGLEGGIKRAQENMQKLADLLASRKIKLTVVVYPWMLQLAVNDRDSRHLEIWRDFCASHCDTFIDLFPAFFAAMDAHSDWLERLFIPGDFHFSAEGNEIIFRELEPRLH